MPELPQRVLIREVGPRDGFEHEPEVIPTHEKLRLIHQLGRSGLKRIEATSFLAPGTLPQFADAADVLEAIDVPDDVAVSVLVRDESGLDRALERRDRFDAVTVLLSAVGTDPEEDRSLCASPDEARRVLGRARSEGLRCAAVIATAFGSPDGEVGAERVAELARALADAGAEEVGFGDRPAVAEPAQVRERLPRWADALPGVELSAHFHNTRGQGLPNVLAALDAGVASFESSFGELGRAPGPEGVTGNVATEELASMLEEMGIETGVTLPALVVATGMVADVLGRPL
jgi:hydroxymethylglutaryl-CoA lyase